MDRPPDPKHPLDNAQMSRMRASEIRNLLLRVMPDDVLPVYFSKAGAHLVEYAPPALKLAEQQLSADAAQLVELNDEIARLRYLLRICRGSTDKALAYHEMSCRTHGVHSWVTEGVSRPFCAFCKVIKSDYERT